MLKRTAIAVIILFLALSFNAQSQTLVASYNFSLYTPYTLFWGVAQLNDSLWLGSNYTTSYLYRCSKTGVISDSILTPFSYNHGLAWDGTGFWVAQDFTSGGAKIFKINRQGVRVDTLITGAYAQGLGGLAFDGNNMWFAVYYPDNAAYPFAYAYKMNLVTKTLVDTIPLRGKQVQGIAVKGDTIFYVNDNFQGEQERIYAYRKTIGDTLFSFPAPDPDNDCDPRGLLWDGQYLWLMAQRIGGPANAYRTLYKYDLNGQGSPQIGTNTNYVNFGNVIIGQTGNQNLIISNTGSAKLIISAFTMTSNLFGISPNNVPDTINPGSNKNYTLSFTPSVYDTAYGELHIASNDGGTPVKIVQLHGKGVYSGPYINISQTTYSYGNTRMNSMCGFTFDISNRGTQPLVINSVAFGSGRYSLDMINVNFPVTIDTQRTRTFRIWFHPVSTNSVNDSAVFSTNAVNNSTAKILLSGTGQNVTTSLGDILWQGNIPNDPNSSFQDYQPKSIKQIPDVNGDGVNDVIVSTANYWTICYNGNASGTADTLWKFLTDFGSINTGAVTFKDALQIIDDINGDGIKDVIIGNGGGNEMVYALSGHDGHRIWAFGDSIGTADGDINGIRVDKDYNNDGVKDVIVSASGEGQGTGRHSLYCLNGLNGQVLFYAVQASEFTYDIVNTTTGGAISIGSNGGPYGLNGFNNTGSLQWQYLVSSAVWSAKNIADINGDGNSDIIGSWGFNGGTFALSGSTGAPIWTGSYGGSNNGTIELLDDLDHNGFADYTLSGPQTAIRMDTKTNTTQWQQFFGASYIRDCDLLGDLNNDTIAEVLYATQQPGNVYVLDGRTGIILFQYSFGSNINQRADRVSKLNSIDGNVFNEFVAGCRDGRIKCFSGGTNGVIGIKPVSNAVPKKFTLNQNYPNPFNPTTKVRFGIPESVGKNNVRLVIYDILGREVSVLINQSLQPGFYEVSWNASNYSSGVYFYSVTAGDLKIVKKMVLTK